MGQFFEPSPDVATNFRKNPAKLAPRCAKSRPRWAKMATRWPSWPQLGRSWSDLGLNLSGFGRSRGRFWKRFGPLCQMRGTSKNLTKTTVFVRFLHVPRISQNGPNRSQNPPRDLPKPDKLKPKSDQDLPSWRQDGHPVAILAHPGPSCCHLGPSWARLCASWRQLCWNFSEIRRYIGRKLEKLSPEPRWTFIFCIFGASGRRFSSLSALRFLSFRLCCPSSVHASIFLSNTFCTYLLRVFPNTAGHQIVLRRLLREA